jgi:hypothetical protein
MKCNSNFSHFFRRKKNIFLKKHYVTVRQSGHTENKLKKAYRENDGLPDGVVHGQIVPQLAHLGSRKPVRHALRMKEEFLVGLMVRGLS